MAAVQIEGQGAPPLVAPPPEQPTAISPGNGAMTRSEEELRVRTVRRPRVRVRLRKYVVTRMVTTTVPVRHEEVRLEREEIMDADADTAPPVPTSSDEAHEVVLHEEQLIIEKRVVPTERVRMGKETIIEEQTVTDELRKEQIDSEADGAPGAKGPSETSGQDEGQGSALDDHGTR